MLAAKLLAASGTATRLFSEDVFAVHMYTGNDATQTITNGIDLAGKGGMVWSKSRGSVGAGELRDSARGTAILQSSTTGAQVVAASDVTAFNSNGYNLDFVSGTANQGSTTFVGWTFRKAPKFFSQATATVTGGADATVSFSDLATLGMVIVKRTDSTGSWYVWHRSLTAGKLLYLEQTAAEATLGHITVSGTTVTLEGGVIANGTYIVYAWAHDTATDGIVQCGTFLTAATTTTSLGWEPQFLLTKSINVAGDNWKMYDASRGVAYSGTSRLVANTSAAEVAAAASVFPTATGFNTISGTEWGNGVGLPMWAAIPAAMLAMWPTSRGCNCGTNACRAWPMPTKVFSRTS